VVRTTRLARGATTGADVDITVYTAPADTTVILKDYRVATPAGNTVARAIVWVESGPAIVPVLDGALAAFDTKGGTPWVVLLPGDELHVQSTVHPGFHYWLSGAELDGVAP
jgi:hypothetical protein